jgi:hypothetical protein
MLLHCYFAPVLVNKYLHFFLNWSYEVDGASYIESPKIDGATKKILFYDLLIPIAFRDYCGFDDSYHLLLVSLICGHLFGILINKDLLL